MGCKNNRLYVRGIFPNSPAKRAGIQLNEEIAQVKFGQGEFNEIVSRNLQNTAAAIQTGKDPFSIKTAKGAVYNIKPEDIIINISNRPSSQSKIGRISKVSGVTVECSLTSRDKINIGDELLIFKGNRIIDTASVSLVMTSGSRLSPRTLKREDYVKLQGASAVLYKTSPSAFRPVYNPDKRDPRFTKINPEVYEYEQRTKKKDSDLKMLPFATIREINLNTKTFKCYVIHGRKRPVGSEGDYLISEVTYDPKKNGYLSCGLFKSKNTLFPGHKR